MICSFDRPLLIVAVSFSIERRGGGDLDALGDALEAERRIDDRVLRQLDLGLARDVLHAREHERQRVGPRRQRRQPVLAVDARRRDARRRQDVGARFDGDARQHTAARVGDLAADGPGLLRVRRDRGNDDGNEEQCSQET